MGRYDRALTWTLPLKKICKAPGGLVLKLPLADVADIGPDHEGELMFRLDCFRMAGWRRQRASDNQWQQCC
jgi:hypothetical protein